MECERQSLVVGWSSSEHTRQSAARGFRKKTAYLLETPAPGIHFTEVGAYLKSTGFADSLPVLILQSRTESLRGRIDILAKAHDECEECAAGPNA